MTSLRMKCTSVLLIATIAAAGASREALAQQPMGQQELPTTAPTIYLSSLEERFKSAVREQKDSPGSVAAHKLLSQLENQRGQYFANPNIVMRALRWASKCLELSPNDVGCLLRRARQRLSLHRFKQARTDLAKAKKLGADPAKIAAIRQELDWNAGNYADAMTSIRQAAVTRPNLRTLARLARLEADLGNSSAAEQAFAAAEAAFVGVDPLPLAWLNVQRGLLYLEQGQPSKALPFYEEAVRRLPNYVLAEEHLAEALAMTGNVDAAVKLYERIISRTPHAESLAALARLYREQGETVKAEAFRRKATKRYNALLRAFPEAMQWHAAQYFLETGQEPERAVRLLERNLKIRPTSDSWWALANAQLANGRNSDACHSVERAIALSVAPTTLKKAANEAFDVCRQNSSVAK